MKILKIIFFITFFSSCGDNVQNVKIDWNYIMIFDGPISVTLRKNGEFSVMNSSKMIYKKSKIDVAVADKYVFDISNKNSLFLDRKQELFLVINFGFTGEKKIFYRSSENPKEVIELYNHIKLMSSAIPSQPNLNNP